MSITHLLETFETSALAEASSEEAMDSNAERELTIYERGYTAGWDDCTKTHAEAETNAEAEFRNNLLELTFTYQEAYSAIIKSLEPLLRQVFEILLPRLAQDSFGLIVKEQILEAAKTHTKSSLLLTCHPSQEAQLASLLESNQAIQIKISCNESFGAGQVTLCFADEEREINIEALSQKINSHVDAFFTDLTKEPVNV